MADNGYARYSGLGGGGGGGGGGVTSLNTLTGALTLAAGSGISITPSGGNTLTIANTGSGSQFDAGNSGTALTINWANAPAQTVTLTGNCTFTFTNPIAGSAYVLTLLQDATGSRTVTWPGNVKWPSGTAPTLTTTAGQLDLINFYYNGTDYFGSSALNYTP